jgi:dihydroflavonol-4-reductase
MVTFVTGATGLLGRNLVLALRAEGHSARALVRSKEKGQRQLGDTGAELVVGDMENVPGFAGGLDGVDGVFHTAAGTLALAEAARARGVKRLIDTSSSGTIGLKPDGSPGDEETPPAPLAKGNLYFKSKVLAAAQLQQLAARTGLDIVQILPGWMFGPGDAAPTGSGQLVLDFLAGKLPAIPPGGTSAVDARDVAVGMISAAERGRAGERYILGGDFVTLADVIRMLGKVTGRSGPRARIPYPVAFVYAAVSELWANLTGGETLVTLKAVRMMQARLAVTSAKAEHELGWKHRPLLETLADEVAWYRTQGLAPEPDARTTAVAA